MINLYEKGSRTPLGTLTESQLKFLIDNLEEEDLEDQDYAITSMTIAYFQEQGADPTLLDLLTQVLGTREEIIIEWDKE